ncbi:hypothetical protein V5O48_000732 [Marasmius crinis-equi]|uniref:Uncharacterized protein n=1 Tax=Marasmius crinis-equi TaxID=585013 RepID=A0ABR3G0N1_9AGAR
MKPDVQQFLHRQCQKVIAKTAQSKTERVILDDDYDCNLSEEQIPQLLSRCARQRTPKPGSSKFISSLPTQPQEYLLSKPIALKRVEVKDGQDVPVNRDKLLEIAWKLTPDMLKDVNGLLRSTGALSAPGASYKNRYLDPFASRDSPSLPDEDRFLFEREFTPIFPRSSRPGAGRNAVDVSERRRMATTESAALALGVQPASMKDLSFPIVGVTPFKQEEDEMYKQNLLLVNGWETYNYSSSPTRGSVASSPDSSQGSDKVDELFLSRLSSPETDPSSVDIPKLDLPAIARCHRISGASSRPKVKPHGAGKSLAAFLLNALPPPGDFEAIKVPVAPQHQNEDAEATDSLLGQATSCLQDGDDDKVDDAEQTDLQGLYKKLDEDPVGFILNEKLDNNAMVMEVPRLPPPNEHPPSSIQLPTKLSDMVQVKKVQVNATSFARTSNTGQCDPQFLRKARGIQAATLALSWVPFSVQYRFPTHMEVVQVTPSQLIDRDDNMNGLSREQIEKGVTDLLDSFSGSTFPSDCGSTPDTLQRASRDHDVERMDGQELNPDFYACHLILIREERKRLAGLDTKRDTESSHPPELGGDVINGGGAYTAGNNREDLLPGRYDDEPEEGSSDKENEAPRHFQDDRPTSDRPSKRARLGEMDQVADDSGIAFTDADSEAEAYGQPSGLNRFLFDGSHDPPGTTWNLDEISEYPELQAPSNDLLSPVDTGLSPYPYGVLEEDLSPSQDDEILPFFPESQPADKPQSLNDFLPSLPSSVLPSIEPSHPVRSRPEPSSAPARALKSKLPDTQESHVPPDVDVEHLHIAAGVAAFAELRAKRLRDDIPSTLPDSPKHITLPSNPAPDRSALSQINENAADLVSISANETPQAILTRNAIQLPSPWMLPTTAHWYMASMSLVQKQALVRHLRSESCGVGTVEREDLNGVDLILDPNTAIIFVNLRALPSQCESVVATISEQSWRYTRLFIIFEAYPPSCSFKPLASLRGDSEVLNVYTPPVIKAIKKLRRDLSVAEGCAKKRASCRVFEAFAGSVEEAGLHARNFGDSVASDEGSGTGLWGDRSWLEGDVSEDEHGLAIADGMNHFAAFVILCQVGVQDVLDMSPEERISSFGPHVGNDKMKTLNEFIQRRLQIIQETDVHNT